MLTADLDPAAYVPDSTRAFWIVDASTADSIGLLRLQDLDDMDDGSPLIDLRIAAPHRGRGAGTAAVCFALDTLFGMYPACVRVEATTRDDNVAMQRVLDRCGFQLEGRMRRSWPVPGAVRRDALVYGILRDEWSPDGINGGERPPVPGPGG